MNGFTKSLGLLITTVCLVATTATGFASTSTSKKAITREKAIALAQEKAEGTLLKAEADYDRNSLTYEIEILDSSQVKHEIEINAYTGKVKKYSQERYSKTKAAKYAGAKLTHNQAIAIAKKETGATKLISSELDNENGMLVYEIKLYDNDSTEYEVLIDANKGTVLFTDTDFDD